jgi:DNA-binding HxlR family transcriptional regulator
MDNLCTKGLIVRDEWFGSEEGWTYKLTDLGRDFMRALVAEIGAPAGRTLR